MWVDRVNASVERRLTRAELDGFKSLTDGDWPSAFDRRALERILAIDFVDRDESVSSRA